MGLTNWKKSPDGKIMKYDISIAKNYLDKEELDKNSTCAKIAQVQKEGNRKVSRKKDYYNLDMII